MSQKITEPPAARLGTFLDFPLETNLEHLAADIGILGIPYGMPYEASAMANDQSRAPDAIRGATSLSDIAYTKNHFDWDLGGPLFDGYDIKIVDCGNVTADTANHKEHYRRAEQAARKIFDANTILVTLGGDHGIPIPVMRALEVHGSSITLVHVDGGPYYLTIDADGIDPTIMPAVVAQTPGGLSWVQIRKLIHGLVNKGRVLGMDLVEIAPAHDVGNITMVHAERLICNFIGASIRAGYYR